MKEKIRLIHGIVEQAVQETHDTWTLHIAVDEKDRRYQAGQFVSIDPHQFAELSNMVAYLENVKGKKELVRAYSMASAPHEPYISITTKPEPYVVGETEFPPLLSPFLASNILLNRPISFLGYTGAYTLPDDHAQHTDHVLHIVAGSGAVPNYALLKDELVNNKNPSVRHTLIDVNKTVGDIIYRDALTHLAAQYPSRFQLVHLLTREEHPEHYGPEHYKGRPSAEFIKQYMGDPARTLVYCCGAGITKWQRKKAQAEGKEATPRFLESITTIVESLGIPKQRFKKEAYG